MTQERPSIAPEDDPYEFDWPDDAKDERAAQRAAEVKRSQVTPAPLLLSAVVIGTGSVLAFLLAVSIAAGSLSFWIAMAAPVVVGGVVLALLPALLLQRATRTWKRGLPEIAFLVLGLAIGGGWSWLFITLFDGASAFRVRASVFMATAVATAFFAARAGAEPFRRYPRYVYSLAAVIAVATAGSIANFVMYNLGGQQ